MTYFHNPEDSLEIFQYPDEVALQPHLRFARLPDEEQTSRYPQGKARFAQGLPVSPAEPCGLQTGKHPCQSW